MAGDLSKKVYLTRSELWVSPRIERFYFEPISFHCENLQGEFVFSEGNICIAMTTNKQDGGDSRNLATVLRGICKISNMLENLTTRVERMEVVLRKLQDNKKGDAMAERSGQEPKAQHQQLLHLNSKADGHLQDKIDIPLFDGSLNMEDFLDWIAKVERYFVSFGTPENEQVGLVVAKFRSGVYRWWEIIGQIQRTQMGNQPTDESWLEMKKMLMDRFLPWDYDQRILVQYHSLQQGQKTVDDYTVEFLRLSSQNNLMQTETQKLSRYVYGLKPTIRERFGNQVILNINQASQFAKIAEGYEKYCKGMQV